MMILSLDIIKVEIMEMITHLNINKMIIHKLIHFGP